MLRTPHTRYVRHRHFNRVRHSTSLLTLLDTQASRLGLTKEEAFDLMKINGYTAVDLANIPLAAPTNVVVPTITGTATSGQTLTVDPGTWSGYPKPVITYQWFKDTGTTIAGATNTTYLIAAGDVGSTIYCSVTATNSEGTQTVSTSPTAAVGA